MIEGARWRTWVFYNIPLILFVIGLLFPFYWMIVTSFRPDSELYRPWNAPNYTPFWTLHPTLVHIRDLLTETLFTTWLMNTMICAVAAQVPVRRRYRHRHFHHLPGAADPAVHSARRHYPQFQARRYALGADSDLSDLFDPVLHLADDGLFQVHPEGT